MGCNASISVHGALKLTARCTFYMYHRIYIYIYIYILFMCSTGVFMCIYTWRFNVLSCKRNDPAVVYNLCSVCQRKIRQLSLLKYWLLNVQIPEVFYCVEKYSPSSCLQSLLIRGKTRRDYHYYNYSLLCIRIPVMFETSMSWSSISYHCNHLEVTVL